MPRIPSPATAPMPHASPPRPVDVIGNLNLERELDPTFRPEAEFRSQINDVASRIEMTTSGPIGYTLDGMKIDSHLARKFLDNRTRTEALLNDPTLTEAPKGVMNDSVKSAALKKFTDYTEKQNSKLPFAEARQHSARVTKKLGRATKHAAIESSKATGKLTKAAMIRAKHASSRAAIAARDKTLEIGGKPKRWATAKYVEVGAFATALGVELPEVLKELDDNRELDKAFYNFVNYDPDNAKEFTNRTIRRASVNLSAVRQAKDAVKNSWKNRK